MENRQEWLTERKKFLGASEIAALTKESKYGCALKTYLSKIDIEPDFDDSDKDVFRRGRRLESVAATYYAEKTMRTLKSSSYIPSKVDPRIRVSPDRIVYKENTDLDPGYLEIKTVSRSSLYNIKKNGLILDYIVQLQVGLEIADLSWGAFCVYCPETDDLLTFDVERDRALGEKLFSLAQEFLDWNVEAQSPPDPLPLGSKPCNGCNYFSSCPNSKVGAVEASREEVRRDDLEATAEALNALREERKALEEAEAELKAKIIDAIEKKPGSYLCGRYSAKYIQTESERFDSKGFKAHDEALWKKFTKTTISNTLRLGAE